MPDWLPLVRLFPTAALAACTVGLAWLERGSIDAADWLPYAVLASLVLATVLVFDNVHRPNHPPLAAFAAMIGLAAWTGLSLAWSPVPSLARDEGLLISLYAVSLVTPALTLKSERERLAALALVALTVSAVAVAVGLILRFGDDPAAAYQDGRLTFPISYVNAQAAFFLVGFWPAAALAVRRELSPFLRAPALGGATALLAGWLLTQSKGGGIALAVSALAVFALAPGRLRLLVPVLIAAGLVAAVSSPLTRPFRVQGEATLPAAIRDAGEALLWLALAATLIGLVVALADRRFRVGRRARLAAGSAVLAALGAALVIGIAAFLARVDDPGRFTDEKWEEFKTLPAAESGGSHLVNLGSNRYDFWRVSLEGADDRPLLGVGARGFGTLYLEERRSIETPARAHSLPLETLLETGVVGLSLLALGLGAAVVLVVTRLRCAWGAGVFGAGVYWFVHAGGDWIWTLPADGVPLFLLLGIAASARARGRLPARAAVPAGIAVALVSLVLFVPPWLSSRFTVEALRTGDREPLDWARRLDPLSTSPLIAEHALATSPAARIAPLRDALDVEPRSSALHYLLGLAYLDAGRRPEARAELREALRLDPRSELVAAALQRARSSAA